MAVMAGHAFSCRGWFVDTEDFSRLGSLVMAVQADLGRCFLQHSGILAGMRGMAGQAFTVLYRFVLRCARHIVMTGQAESAINGAHFNSGTLDLVTLITFAASYRRVGHLPEKSRVT